MSTEAVNQFLTKIGEDKELQAALTQAMEGENDRQAIVKLAASYGCNFTVDELDSEIANLQKEFERRQESGELNEEELEAVAGGYCIMLTLNVAGIAHGVWTALKK